ncbi:MAG: hypothetical protein GX115_00855 [Ruminiclostridium sp.]|nr:hypothetical protein [Ruminiclostridium sp.]
MKKILVIVICVVALYTSSLTAFAVTPYGAEAVDENRTYTLPEMLTLAIEDEYLAYARYENVIQKFGASRPSVGGAIQHNIQTDANLAFQHFSADFRSLTSF